MMDLLRRSADPNYFQAAGVPLLKGRTFTDRDGQGYDDAHPHLDALFATFPIVSAMGSCSFTETKATPRT